jgi:hypothetical protein
VAAAQVLHEREAGRQQPGHGLDPAHRVQPPFQLRVVGLGRVGLGRGVGVAPRSVSPGRSPNPPCGSLRNGLSTGSVVRRGWVGPRGWGSCCRGSGTGRSGPSGG